MGNQSIALMPLFDMCNHRQPVKPDTSDLVTFTFSLTGSDLDLNDDNKRLGFVVKADYFAEEELNYSYTHNIDVTMMLVSYGMAFDNSPYARVTLQTSNIFKERKDFKNLFKICLIIGCFERSVL